MFDGRVSFHSKDSYFLDSNGVAWQETKGFFENQAQYSTTVADAIADEKLFYARQRDEWWLLMDPDEQCPPERWSAYCAKMI